MRLKSLCLLLTLILSGCLAKQPKAKPRPECQLIRTQNLEDSYLYCVWSDTKDEYTLKLTDLPTHAQNDQEIYVCTTLKGYVEVKTYEQNLQSWINNFCRR